MYNNKNYETEIKKGGFQRLINVTENILLRPNDNKIFFGEDNFNKLKIALENILEKDYKHHLIYRYYYELNNISHGFCTFERWKLGLFY